MQRANARSKRDPAPTPHVNFAAERRRPALLVTVAMQQAAAGAKKETLASTCCCRCPNKWFEKQRRTAAEKASTVKRARQAEAGGAAAESGDGVIIIGRACATATAVEDQAENYWYTFSMGTLCSCQIFSLVAVVFGLGEDPLPDPARACAASAHFLSQGTDVSTESDP